MQPALHPATKAIVLDTPVLMLPGLARTIGMDDAMLLQQIHYWLSLGGHEHDGRRWIYNTYHAWAEQFPGWSKDKVRRIVERLRGRGLVQTARYNRHAYDQTTWYTIDYDAVAALGLPLPDTTALGPAQACPSERSEESSHGHRTPAISAGAHASPGGADAPRYGTHASRCGADAPRCGADASRCGTSASRCGDFAPTIPETTTEITSEITSEINNRERERDGAPSPSGFENFTMTETLTGWWAAECATCGVPGTGIDVRSETDKWRDEIRAGRRPVPADAAADWRQWMRRALAHYRRYPPPGAPPAVRTVPTVDAADLAAREAAAARLRELVMQHMAERAVTAPPPPVPRAEPEVDSFTAFRNRAGALFGRAPVAPGEERAPRLGTGPRPRVTADGPPLL
jgi:hypothetical protein